MGRTVRQPAKDFGRAWAQEEFGDAWETAVCTGEVINVRGNGTSARKPVLVAWMNGDEEPMTFDQIDAILDAAEGNAATWPALLFF